MTLALIAACSGDSRDTPVPPVPFELTVSPAEYFPVIPRQSFVILVTVAGGEDAVTVDATVDGAADVEPSNRQLLPGEVGEFTLVAREGSEGSTVGLEFEASRLGAVRRHSLPVEVVEWSDDIQPFATELRERFVQYLSAERPELGIDADTRWTASITKPQILVVMHYLFFSEDWEMGIMWHVTVPEHAWSRMYLRPRDELRPTIGLEIPSYPDPGSTPVPWDPPLEVDR